MWPLLAGFAARAGGQAVARTAVTAAAESGAIRAGTTSGTRMLSAAQFANAGASLASRRSNETAPAAQTTPAAGDGLGWMRS